jgi:hypothetical protein
MTFKEAVVLQAVVPKGMEPWSTHCWKFCTCWVCVYVTERLFYVVNSTGAGDTVGHPIFRSVREHQTKSFG